MEQEILQQPSTTRATASAFPTSLSAELKSREIELILIAARGSSDNAAMYARYLFEIELGIPVVLAAPSVLTRYGRKVKYPKCLGIGISQSGAAPDVSEVIASLREEGHTTIALTNTSDSRLTQSAEFSIFFEAGEERAVAATKTYSSSLVGLYELCRSLGSALPSSIEFLPTDAWVEEARHAAASAAGQIVRVTTVFSLARGYGFCTAIETSLKLMECALIPSKSYSTADFAHGPKALASHGTAAIVFGENVEWLEGQGCEIVLAPAPPAHIPDQIKPIWDIIFGQWLALYVARARGLDPDHPRNLTKVTETR